VSLHFGPWQEALQHIERCDAVIVDTPFTETTHNGQVYNGRRQQAAATGRGLGNVSASGLGYNHWTREQMCEFATYWAAVCSGWLAVLCDDYGFSVYREILRDLDRVVFQDVPIVLSGMSCRLSGDGPSSAGVHMCVARPRGKPFSNWGTLPGSYIGKIHNMDGTRPSRPGGKPDWLMRAIVRDYSNPGDLVVDPTCGAGTTLRACQLEGRQWTGAEIDPEAHADAARWLAEPYTQPMITPAETFNQSKMFL